MQVIVVILTTADFSERYINFFLNVLISMSWFFSRMAEFLGYDPESLIGKSVFEFCHAQDSQDVGKAFKSCK